MKNLQDYRRCKAEMKAAGADDSSPCKEGMRLNQLARDLKNDMPYFGYGFIDNAEQTVPFIPICFYAFRVMVGLGSLFMLFFLVLLFMTFKRDITRYKWLHLAAVAMIPLAWVCSEAGWIVAEMGRQPWAIQDMMPTWTAVSDVSTGTVATTMILFVIIFTSLLIAEISIMCKQIKRGPEA